MTKIKAENLNYVITNTSATVYLDDGPRTIFKDEAGFSEACDALRGKQWNVVSKMFDISIEGKSDGKMRRDNDSIEVLSENKWIKVPEALGTVISKFIDMDLPFEPLVNFAIKLVKNPSQNSINQLFSFINKNDITLTDSGDFMVYKLVRSDYKDIHSGTFDNSPGAEPEMDRSKVVDDPTKTCSAGLHVAAYHYIADGNFGGGHKYGNKLMLCQVDPTDVVSVPNDYQFSKMRVCKYKVLSEIEHQFDAPLYSSERGFYGTTDDESFMVVDFDDEYEEVE